MDRDQELGRAIRQRDIELLTRLMFSGNSWEIRAGFRTETEFWDFKEDCPSPSGHGREARDENAWAEIVVDVLAFHNSKGGA
jgi:hypothetical protein